MSEFGGNVAESLPVQINYTVLVGGDAANKNWSHLGAILKPEGELGFLKSDIVPIIIRKRHLFGVLDL